MLLRRSNDRRGVAIKFEVARLFSAHPCRMPRNVDGGDETVVALQSVAARIRHHTIKQHARGIARQARAVG